MIDACSNGMEQHGAVLSLSQDSFLMQVNGYLMSHSVENFDLSVYLLRGWMRILLKLHGSTD